MSLFSVLLCGRPPARVIFSFFFGHIEGGYINYCETCEGFGYKFVAVFRGTGLIYVSWNYTVILSFYNFRIQYDSLFKI
jgi:hypothetical protein